jgi:hypothetical protein
MWRLRADEPSDRATQVQESALAVESARTEEPLIAEGRVVCFEQVGYLARERGDGRVR